MTVVMGLGETGVMVKKNLVSTTIEECSGGQ